MSCESCATRVARALDSVAGTWATVDLSSRTAHVRSKTPIDLDAYRSVVSEAVGATTVRLLIWKGP